MNKQALRQMIDSLLSDIEFDYNGVHGAICPFSRTDIVVGFGDTEVRYSSVDEVMESDIFNGNRLEDICEKLSIY